MAESLYIGAFGGSSMGMLDSAVNRLNMADTAGSKTVLDVRSAMKKIQATRAQVLANAARKQALQATGGDDVSFYGEPTVEASRALPPVIEPTTMDKVKKYAPYAFGGVAIAAVLAIVLKR